MTDSYLSVEFVIAQIQGCVDWFERLKVDVDFFLFALFCHNGSTIHHQAIVWHCIKTIWEDRNEPPH